ncbi:hypothetical protein HDU76_007950, partial [Blyttiomyces sp. JEL0837]
AHLSATIASVSGCDVVKSVATNGKNGFCDLFGINGDAGCIANVNNAATTCKSNFKQGNKSYSLNLVQDLPKPSNSQNSALFNSANTSKASNDVTISKDVIRETVTINNVAITASIYVYASGSGMAEAMGTVKSSADCQAFNSVITNSDSTTDTFGICDAFVSFDSNRGTSDYADCISKAADAVSKCIKTFDNPNNGAFGFVYSFNGKLTGDVIAAVGGSTSSGSGSGSGSSSGGSISGNVWTAQGTDSGVTLNAKLTINKNDGSGIAELSGVATNRADCQVFTTYITNTNGRGADFGVCDFFVAYDPTLKSSDHGNCITKASDVVTQCVANFDKTTAAINFYFKFQGRLIADVLKQFNGVAGSNKATSSNNNRVSNDVTVSGNVITEKVTIDGVSILAQISVYDSGSGTAMISGRAKTSDDCQVFSYVISSDNGDTIDGLDFAVCDAFVTFDSKRGTSDHAFDFNFWFSGTVGDDAKAVVGGSSSNTGSSRSNAVGSSASNSHTGGSTDGNVWTGEVTDSGVTVYAQLTVDKTSGTGMVEMAGVANNRADCQVFTTYITNTNGRGADFGVCDFFVQYDPNNKSSDRGECITQASDVVTRCVTSFDKSPASFNFDFMFTGSVLADVLSEFNGVSAGANNKKAVTGVNKNLFNGAAGFFGGKKSDASSSGNASIVKSATGFQSFVNKVKNFFGF